ncbi:hypothetical protein FNV43_RR23146 [Rhamnella rubrinervis]|uniref:F-box domain-containing protein n=1 Tax=Rhamnella rubrinervis TaxID=2594499 RepID=A0A8K0DXZ2_9ROSA|nr:hypothetical protein FNV43_RR23146 [Rhamnella rubrinervis]
MAEEQMGKKRETQKEDEDHMSKLPEEILVWILCKLSVEAAARMSVVSRRWNKLWKKAIVVTLSLKFYCSKINRVLGLRSVTSDNKMQEYVNRVNQVLKLHKRPTLDEFTVAYPLHSKYSRDINKWVEFAAKKQVKKLALNFCVRYHSIDKKPSYDCGFLTSSGGIKFHELTDLYLKGVDVTDNVIHCLLSNSPLIERLCVNDSKRLHNLEVTASNLRYLDIRLCKKLEYLKIHAPNLNVMKLHTLAADPIHIRVNLYAPNLSRLSVVFSFARCLSEPILWPFTDYFQELFAQFSQVKKRLSIKIFPEVVCAIAKTSFVPHPELSYVEHLKVTVDCPWPSWYRATTYSWFQGILWPSSLVKAAPSLHKLSLKLFHRGHKFTLRDIDVMWRIEDIAKKVKENVGNYSHQNLKVVELIGYTGVRYEIQLLLHLVEIAASLEKLVIHVCVPNLYWHKEEHILRDDYLVLSLWHRKAHSFMIPYVSWASVWTGLKPKRCWPITCVDMEKSIKQVYGNLGPRSSLNGTQIERDGVIGLQTHGEADGNRGKKSGEDEVHINKLPEDILVWILCKLSVEEAARTSVVSRRWNKLWKKAIVVTPSLKFPCFQINRVIAMRSVMSDNKMHEYVNRVNQVLKLHTPPALDEFTVAYPLHSKYSQGMNKWVEFAAKKQVKKLILDFCIRNESIDRVPFYDGGFLASSGSIKFHKLRDLYLRGVDVTDNVIHSLLSNSPLIERLCVINSQGLHNLEVTASNLRYLYIRRCENLKYLKIYAPNLSVMKLHAITEFPINPKHVHFDSYAPNLSRLSIDFWNKISRSVVFHSPTRGPSVFSEALPVRRYSGTKYPIVPAATEDEDQSIKLAEEILESIMCLLPVEGGARASVVCWRWNKLWKKAIVRTPRLDFYVTNRMHCMLRWPCKTSESEDEDHISKLPEEILVWILYKLSVEEAARMTVVSRRWYELWKKAIVVSPRLEFYCSKINSVFGLRSRTSDNKMHEYVNRVNQVLKLHKPPTLDEFAVSYPLHSKYSQDINNWVEFAAKKQVKKLALNFCIRYQSTDKEPSYDCGFLTSSGGMKFHKLRDLYLVGVDVTDNAIHCLLSNSPLIERLCVIDSQRLHNLEVTASNLRYLVIRRCEKLEYVKIYAPNLNVLKLHRIVIHFNLYAPNLSRLSVVFSRIVYEPILRPFSDYFHELFAQFSHVKKRLSIKIFSKVFCAIAKTSFVPHPELSYVEHLKVTVNCPWPSWYKATTYSWFQGILWPSSLVKAAPSLHKLSVKVSSVH